MIAKLFIVMIMAIVVVGVASAGTVNSMVDFTATGMVSTSTAIVDESCGSIGAFGSNTFGVASLEYSQAQAGNHTARDITTTAGFLIASDSMMSTVYQNPTENCNGQTCTVTPGFYNTVVAQSDVLLYGPGTVATSTGLGMFNLAATGNGTLSQSIGVIDISQTVGENGKLNTCLNDMRYSQKTMMMDKFNFASKFSYTR